MKYIGGKVDFAASTGQIRPKVIKLKKEIFEKIFFWKKSLFAVSGLCSPQNAF
jgi:hypothetical protein